MRGIVDERCRNSFTSLPEKLLLRGWSSLQQLIAAFTLPLGAESLCYLHAPQTKKRTHASMSQQVKADLNDLLQWDEKCTGLEQLLENFAKHHCKSRGGRVPLISLNDIKKAYYIIGPRIPSNKNSPVVGMTSLSPRQDGVPGVRWPGTG